MGNSDHTNSADVSLVIHVENETYKKKKRAVVEISDRGLVVQPNVK